MLIIIDLLLWLSMFGFISLCIVALNVILSDFVMFIVDTMIKYGNEKTNMILNKLITIEFMEILNVRI